MADSAAATMEVLLETRQEPGMRRLDGKPVVMSASCVSGLATMKCTGVGPG